MKDVATPSLAADLTEPRHAVTPPSYRSLWALRREHGSPLGFLASQAERGDIAEFTIRNQRTFLLSHPAAIEQVLVSHGSKFSKGPAIARAGRLLGQGLLTAEPPRHTERRRAIVPAFHRQRLERYATAMAARTEERTAAWQPGAEVDALAEITAITLAAVGDTLFGVDIRPYEARIRRAVVTAMAVIDPLVSLIAPARRVRPGRRRLLEVVEQLVERRIASGELGDDLISLLLAQEETPSREQLYDDVLTILLAGHDTISTALTWSVLFLSARPDVDARLHEEASTVLGDRLATYADVANLPYARAVLAESLRLRPPAWVLARRALEAHDLGGAVMPPGSLVLMSSYLVHRDPRFYDRPSTFDPDRWLRPALPDRPKLAYFPFGAGRRSCIGESFAWLEGVVVLSTIARRWRLRLAGPPPEPELRITMRPLGPVMMTAERRGH